MGFYEGKPAYMQAFRRKIDAAPKRFARLAGALAKHTEFQLYGECYKRPMGKGGYPPEIMEWYQRKTLGLSMSRPVDERLFSADLIDFVLQEWKKLEPMYRFLREIPTE